MVAVASYRFSRYVLLRPMILKRDGRTIKKGWSYQGKLISEIREDEVHDSNMMSRTHTTYMKEL